MALRTTLITLFLLLTTLGCNNPQSPRGFSLPVGDADAGEATFVELQCHYCHTVEGVDLPPVTVDQDVWVALGGPVQRVKTYGQLVTSIINPSHKLGYPGEGRAVDGRSRMTVYNDVLTVTQLINLVAFLEAHYELQPYEPTDYPLLP